MNFLRRFLLILCVLSFDGAFASAIPHKSGSGDLIKYARPKNGHAFDPALEHQPMTVDYDYEKVGKILYDMASMCEVEITFPKRVYDLGISLKLKDVSYRVVFEEIARKASLKVKIGTGEAFFE